MLFARQGKKFDYDLKQVLNCSILVVKGEKLASHNVFKYNSSISHILNFIQLRFAGDLLMELGAGVELATAAVPHLFLPLACAANVAKV